MKRKFYPAIILSSLLIVLAACNQAELEPSSDDLQELQGIYELEGDIDLETNSYRQGHMVVANRASGTISAIEVATGNVKTFALPQEAGDAGPEPMYVVWSPLAGRVFVGDRANNRIAVFTEGNFEVVGTVPAGQGIFHMWADLFGEQLWVVNDVDNSATVINTHSLEVITTVAMPNDLVAAGGKPHDLVVDPLGRYAYVTIIGIPDDSDYVVQFSTRTFQEVRRAAAGDDSHLALSLGNPNLYVPSQQSNEVIVYNRNNLRKRDVISVDNAHGAGIYPFFGRTLYTTNIAGGGTDGLVTIKARGNQIIDVDDTPFATPHNIALTPNGKLYITHSGATSDKVSVYDIRSGTPELLGTADVGLNPFGLAFSR